jgi:hypothetical protein
MMAVGFGYRLLPMMLSAAPPSGRAMYPSAILLETGILGLFLSLLMRSPLTLLFAAVIAAGLAVFGSHVVRMLARRTTAPVGRLRDDFAGEHIGAAGGWLLMAVISGIALAALPMSEWTIRVALVYGVAGLVGGLAQSVIGFQRRTLPQMAAREWRYAVIFFAWLAGVPLLAGGFVLNAPPVLALGGGVLFAAALLMCADVARMISAPRPRR